MNSYLKPQSPIKDRDGDYIYPLTTIDQIIMSDGSRLSNSIISDVQIEDILTESANYANTQITDRVIYGKGKNLLKNTAKSQTVDGVTFTVNADGSVTVNGTATSDIYRKIATATLDVRNQYTLTGSPNLGDSLAAALYVNTEIASGNGWNYNQPATFSVKASGSFNINLYIKSGYTANNLTFYPMIRLASETDDTYEPYYKGLAELTDRGMELLWENASIGSDFEPQTIKLNLEDFNSIFVVFTNKLASVQETVFSKVGQDSRGMGISMNAIVWRQYTSDKTGVTFSSCNVNDAYGPSIETRTINNSVLLPYEIYGVKGVLA